MILLYSILFTSALVVGITIAGQDGMLLYEPLVKPLLKINRARRWRSKKEIKLFKVIALCVWCMPSFYSIFGLGFAFWFENSLDLRMLAMYPIIVCASSIVSGVSWNLIQKSAQ